MQHRMFLRIVGIGLVVSATVWLSCKLDISDPVTSIRGVVTDSVTGEPFDSAVINLRDTVSTNPSYADSLGRYAAGSLGYGPRRVFCRKVGYRSQSIVVISSEERATITGVNFQLSPE